MSGHTHVVPDAKTPVRPTLIHVLVLEDVPSDAELMLHELRRAGFDPDWRRVDTESEYLAHLDDGLDVILADYRLPQFDALGALYHLNERGLDIPFIIVSGAISEEAAVGAMKQGASDYVLKDRMARLGQAVARALEEKERRVAKERAEKALRESEEHFRLLVDGGRDYAIAMLDPDGCIVSWNPGAERIHGYRTEEILAQHFSRFHPPSEHGNAELESELETAATQGRYEEQGWRVRKDGTRFWADIVITALHHPSGDLRGFSKVTRDITERKRAEEALARQSAELARSNAELEIFGNVASHDLKEPLRVVGDASRRLSERWRGKLDGESERLLADTIDAVTRMGTLIDDLLAYSRANQQGNVFVATDCAAVFDSAVANLAMPIRESGAGVTRDALPVVTADPSQLLQLFQNLIANAIKYRGADSPRVHVTASREAGIWTFAVRDNGAGVPAGEGDRVFELFHRLQGRPDVAGAGIGLAICKKVVERHGGKIWFEPNAGGGTTFSFTLPAGPHDA
jgi:PAS domain S-box-containing protein